MSLMEYGIQNEVSDIRAHVCPIARVTYVFLTKYGRETISQGVYDIRPAYQQGIKTAEGYLVPPFDIPEIRPVPIFPNWLKLVNFDVNDPLNVKGQKAVWVVKAMLQNGAFPLWADPEDIKEIADQDLQIDGMDLLVHAKIRIQVKCDYRGGIGEGTTGNLFLQIAESNPFGIY